jgi:hypothetical protein
MKNRVEFFSSKNGRDFCGISKIDLVDGDVFGDGEDVRPLDLRIVKVVEIVDDRHIVAIRDQFFNQMRADEPGPTGDQNSH